MLNPEKKRVLYIDLTDEKSEIKVHSDLELGLGGVGLASLLFQDSFSKSPVVFSIGPLGGLFPGCSSTCAFFKSPLTNDIAESYGGGWLGAALRFSHLDAVVFSGKANRPVYLVVEDGEVSFKDASSLWGKSSSESFEYLSNKESSSGRRSILLIGPAGEKQVSFANLLVDRFFEFRRFGLGKEFGRRNLKGCVFSGSADVEIDDETLYSKLTAEIGKSMQDPEDSRILPNFAKFGYLANLSRQNEISGIPVKNLRNNRIANFSDLKEQALTRKFSYSPVASFGSPLPEVLNFNNEGVSSPLDYENVVSLGPLLGIDDPGEIIKLNSLARELGLDPVSLGFSLSYLSELKDLTFKDFEAVQPLVNNLVMREDEWAVELSKGLREASLNLGGQDFALQINGSELAPYFNGYATILSQVIGASHQIYDNEGHRLDAGLLGQPFDDEEMVEALMNKEKFVGVLNSLGVDYYARGMYADSSLIFSALQCLGISKPKEELERFSRGLYHLKWKLKKRMGFQLDNLQFPDRIFQTPTAYGLLKEKRLRSLTQLFGEKYLS